MMERSARLLMDLAGLKVEFSAGEDAGELVPAAKFRGELTEGLAEVRLAVRRCSAPVYPPGPALFSARNWSLFQAEGRLILQLTPPVDPARYPVQALALDPDGRGGELWVTDAGAPAAPLSLPPGILDELLLVYLLARGWGVMLHACGLATAAGKGLLFSGVSGAGKSTTARLWQRAGGCRLLSDERVALRRQAGKFWIHGTPWNSADGTSEGGRAPLQALFLIRHAATHQARRLGTAEALAQLLPLAYLPHGDAQGLSFTLEFLEQLVRSMPCYDLGFVPDAGAVAYVQRLVEG